MATDPPFCRLDLVSCRNVLIYMDAALQKRVLPLLHYALNPDGFLFLGTSENIGGFIDLFEVVEPSNRIFAKQRRSATPPLDFNAASPARRRPRPIGREEAVAALDRPGRAEEADRVLLCAATPRWAWWSTRR